MAFSFLRSFFSPSYSMVFFALKDDRRHYRIIDTRFVKAFTVMCRTAAPDRWIFFFFPIRSFTVQRKVSLLARIILYRILVFEVEGQRHISCVFLAKRTGLSETSSRATASVEATLAIVKWRWGDVNANKPNRKLKLYVHTIYIYAHIHDGTDTIYVNKACEIFINFI